MQQSLRYRGLSLTPDEMAVENGALSLCGNIELHDGALRPSYISGTTLANSLLVGDVVAKLLYIHETSNYRHLIAVASSAVYYFNEDGSIGSSTPIKSLSFSASVLSINSIGNTLVIVASDGIYYALWIDGAYKYLGQKPPFIDIGFSLSTEDEAENYDNGGVDTDGSANGFKEAFQQTIYTCDEAYNKVVLDNILNMNDVECLTIKEDIQSDLTQSIYALVNRTNNLIARNGRFYTNFFIRYCYRMFDGSMIMHSAPVFMPVQVPYDYMVCSANATSALESGNKIHCEDKVNVTHEDSKGNEITVKLTKAAFYYYPRNVALTYELVAGSVEELNEWKDIVKSVDVFITAPITKIDTSEKITSLRLNRKYYALGRGEMVRTGGVTSTVVVGRVTVDFPSLTEDAYRNKLKNTSAFFKICSINVSDLPTTSTVTDLPVDKNAVYQVSLQEQMKDDYKTHNYLYAEGSYVYNHRLNLYGVKEKLFEGFNSRIMYPNATKIKDCESSDMLKVFRIVVQLNTTSGTKYVVKAAENYVAMDPYMISNLTKFYPDSRAEKMYLFCIDSNSNYVYLTFPLEQCDELNGAIHMGDFTDNIDTYKDSTIDMASFLEDDIVDQHNKIYTSESDNAFYFPVNGINTVGIGNIQGIASTTRALSQGQFGQYPLMAFSTDGIWALDVSSTGTYSSIHPISREVCSNPSAITQLDQSVLFVTSRSVSRVAESQVASMSDVLDGPYFDVSALQKFYSFFDNQSSDMFSTTIGNYMKQLIDFNEQPIDFVQNCLPVYDYINSRILFLDIRDNVAVSDRTVALAYSIRDSTWNTLVVRDVLTALNSYPHPYIQYSDGSVIRLDKGYDFSDKTLYHGILVTRTLKFDEENVPDAITGYIHSLTTDNVPVMWIYGSNDNQHWHYVGRVGGMKSNYMASRSYRFFRIAMYLRMMPKDQYFATRLEVIRRFGKF